MALHFELVAPERQLFSGDVDQVDVPGLEGDVGILADHAPLVTALRPGLVTVHHEAASEVFVVIGGFAEVSPDGLTILADRAAPRDAFDATALASDVRQTEESLAASTDEAQRDKLGRHLDQLKALQAALGQA